MKNSSRIMRSGVRVFLAACLILPGASLLAGNKIIYVHGFATSKAKGNARYTCQGKTKCTVGDTWVYGTRSNSVHVGWKSHLHWKTHGPYRLLAMLNKYCKSSYCDIVAHSAGTVVTGYTLDRYGKNYKIGRVIFLGAAQGGTEMATTGTWLTLGLLSAVKALTPSYTRGAYDHNDTAGNTIYNYAGRCSVNNPIILGADDWVIPLHSACAYKSAFLTYKCSGGKKRVGFLKWRTVGKWKNHKSKDVGCVRHAKLKRSQYHYSF